MMDPAYFVGRKAILIWLNDTFHMNLSKIEETASGKCTQQANNYAHPHVPRVPASGDVVYDLQLHMFH